MRMALGGKTTSAGAEPAGTMTCQRQQQFKMRENSISTNAFANSKEL
jgi:hypothetical protein